MFIIKDNQLDVFKEASLGQFENDMVDHIKAFFPNHYNAIGEANVRATIRYGYKSAKSYGFISVRNVCLYLNNMLLLGSNFDQDPQYPGARAIIVDKSIQDTNLKIDRLCDYVLPHIAQVSGPANIYIYRTLLNFTKNADAIFQSLSSSDLTEALSHLKTLFKQKYDVVGEDNLNKMINTGVRSAERYGIRKASNALTYIVFMFMMGSGYDKDPQFSWAGQILNERSLDENEKITTLYQTAMSYLSTALLKYNH